MFFKLSAAALAAAFLLSACAHNAPKPHGKPFPINLPSSSGEAETMEQP
ncbi:TPA: hypothetical protein ACFNMI_000037 [Neisseria bacilliformis]